MTIQNEQITIYFDGLCQLCSREINHYRKQHGSDNIKFTDITDTSFDAKSEGLDPVQVHKVMHVKNSDGRLRTGVDAFVAIWEVLPNYNWLAKLAKNSFLRPVLNIGYDGFAAIRPYLPRKKNKDCEQSPYCEPERKS